VIFSRFLPPFLLGTRIADITIGMRTLANGEHLQCLDVLKVALPTGAHDCAILLEIWDHGGLLQTNDGIPEGSLILLESIRPGIAAKVVFCEQDAYGFLVRIEIPGPGWFPEVYTPPHIIWS
jgi:hypothetical protein